MNLPRVAFVATSLLILSGCGSLPSVGDAPDDEAMVRARKAGLKPDEAARKWFHPGDDNIHDYFPGMDKVVVQGVTDGVVDPLNTPVYQLLDREVPAAVLVDPALSKQETFGRNAWMIWCGGNEGFWDWLANNSFGFLDLLKVLDTRRHSTRFRDAGLINEPGMTHAGSQDEFGLWLDLPADSEVRRWRRDYVRRAFANIEQGSGYANGDQASSTACADPTRRKYPGYGDYCFETPPPPPDIYGLSSGVVGLRLFPNPKFDAAARKKWDNARRYYTDPDFYNDRTLVRPYRIGMSCAFCHASFHPLNPPANLANPRWENISGNIGAQYLRIRAVFGNLLPRDNLIYHILDSQPPGTIDTSLIASDNINNPNAMNSIFNLPQRALVSFRNPREKQAGPAASLPSIWRRPDAGAAGDGDDPVPPVFQTIFESVGLADELRASNGDPRRVPRILFDGADSIGAWGALSRVYLNIGTHYEQWVRLHRTIVGFAPQRPFTLEASRQHSVYWHATQLRVAPMRDYFLKVTPPMPLVVAGVRRAPDPNSPIPVTADHIRQRVDITKLARGRQVFAHNCIVCHSSIQSPERFAAMNDVPHPGEYWDHNPGQWVSDPKYIQWAEAEVEKPEFWRLNYLSTDYRIPVNVIGTNSCRALATNALTGNMWEDYASESYRTMASVGAIPYFNPYAGERGGEEWFTPRHGARPGAPSGGGGPGYYRVPTLVSIWTSAPLLHNNSLGLFNNDPSVEGRLRAFDDAIRKLLWPERRQQSSSYNNATPERLKADHGLIWRTTEDTYVDLKGRYVPGIVSQVGIFSELQDRFGFLTYIRPPWAPSGVLLLIAFLALLFPKPWISRVVGYAAIILAIAIALAIYFWNGELLGIPVRPILRSTPSWLTAAVLFIAGLLFARLASHRTTKAIGYIAIVSALVVGVMVYFWNGDIGDFRIGPFPKGTPVSLIANVNPEAPNELRHLLRVARDTFSQIESQKLTGARREALFRQKLAPALMDASRCPDFVMDRGHYFEWFKRMSDDDKNALIELLKTF